MTRALQGLFAALCVAFLSACPPPPPPIMPNEEVDVPYDGESMSGVIPTFDKDGDADAGVFIIDAGMVAVEMRCCATNFSIPDEDSLLSFPNDELGSESKFT